MGDPYSILGISSGADEETLKKAYRQKCKQYHPDLHPNDPACEEKFKEVQAAYSEITRIRNGGSPAGAGGYGARAQSADGYSRQAQDDPFGFGGFGYGPFGFGFDFGGDAGGSARSGGQESPEMQAANNYIRNGYYQEAMNVLAGIPENERTARWHYYAALASAGLGNNIRAQTEARAAVAMEPGNYEYQNLLDRLQHPGSSYTAYQRQYTQPGSRMNSGICRFCVTLWMAQMVCQFLSCCCGGRSGGYFFI